MHNVVLPRDIPITSSGYTGHFRRKPAISGPARRRCLSIRLLRADNDMRRHRTGDVMHCERKIGIDGVKRDRYEDTGPKSDQWEWICEMRAARCEMHRVRRRSLVTHRRGLILTKFASEQHPGATQRTRVRQCALPH